MRDFPGAPGTYVGVLLRCFQLLFSGFTMLCLYLMVARYHHLPVYVHGFRVSTSVHPFRYLLDPLIVKVELIFSTCMLSLILANRTVVITSTDVKILAVLDWVVATLSLRVTSVLVGTSMYLPTESICMSGVGCRMLQLSLVSAFVSWLANICLHLVTLWVLAGGV